MSLPELPFLFTVTDRFPLDKRGLLMMPGLPYGNIPAVRRGDPLTLRTPLGDIIETSIKELEWIRYIPPEGRSDQNSSLLILLPKGIHKFDIPIGTEVFLGSNGDSSP